MNILLIHGWDFDNYFHRTNKIAWSNRTRFIKELEKKHNVFYPDLPGFGLEKEPKSKKWDLNDYAKYIQEYINNNSLNIDYIIGYSFGGAVAVKYKELYNKNIKEILISPALIRNNEKSKKFIKTPKFLNPIRNKIREIYLKKIIKNKETIYGTKFLKNTYQEIVRINMLPTIEKLNNNDFTIIYGSEDNMVNPNKVINTVKNELKNNIIIIDGGGHDIANTHTEKLIQIINDQINK